MYIEDCQTPAVTMSRQYGTLSTTISPQQLQCIPVAFKNACAIPSHVHRCCVNLILTFSQNDELLCQSCVTPTDLLNQCHQGTAACSPGQEEPSPCPNVVWLQFKPYSHSTNLHESCHTEYTTITTLLTHADHFPRVGLVCLRCGKRPNKLPMKTHTDD
jgi:hypothetical protein